MQLASSCTLLLGAVLAVGGCGGESGRDEAYYETRDSGRPAAAPTAPVTVTRQEAAADPAMKDDVGGEAIALPQEGGPDEADEAPRPVRRVIYNATLDLTVADLDGVAETVARLVADAGGYVANSTIRGTSGSQRSATWAVRVPIEKFDAFLREAARLGEVNSLSTGSQEVTAEFYDAEARLRNKRQEEERLLELLETGAGTLEDILKVETEVSRVRQEIEQIEGRLRLLRDLTALSTATIHATEVREYIATQPGGFPTFGERVSTAWTRTLDALLQAGQFIVILAVAVAPWLGVLAVLALPGLLLYRFVRRMARAAPVRPGQRTV
jgi:hypothetical protein